MTKKVALAFSVSGTRLGLDVAAVREVMPAVKLVMVPEMPALLRGFLMVGGHTVPVIRLELLLRTQEADVEAAPIQLTDRLVLVELKRLRIAWLAAEGMELIDYHAEGLAPLPEGHLLNDCTAGVIEVNPPVVLLQPERVLLETERLRLQQLQKRHEDRLALSAVGEAA